jgi:PAS domain S-box-containing protein
VLIELRLRIKTILRLNRFHCIEEEKERNEKLLSMSPHGIVIIDQKGSIETLNQTFFDMLGMTKESTLKGNLLESYIHPDHQVNYRNKLKELDQSPTQRLILETFIMSASGFFLPVQMMIGRFPGKSGDSYQLNIRDLSYEKKIVSDLNILMKAVQQSQIMFMILDLDLNLTYVNPQTCSKMGYTEKELLGTKFTKHYPFELNQAFHNNLKTIRKEKKEWKGELVCVTKPGESLNECVSISPLTDATGYVTHYVKISEEITNKSH